MNIEYNGYEDTLKITAESATDKLLLNQFRELVDSHNISEWVARAITRANNEDKDW